MFKVEFEGWRDEQLRIAIDHGSSRLLQPDAVTEIMLPGGWKSIVWHTDHTSVVTNPITEST